MFRTTLVALQAAPSFLGPRHVAALEQAAVDAARAVLHPVAKRSLGELGLVKVSETLCDDELPSCRKSLLPISPSAHRGQQPR